MIRLSVGVITNGSRVAEIKRCLCSIERSVKSLHSKPDVELIISCDGDIRSVQKMCEELTMNWKIMQGPRRGIGANRQAVLEACNGDWVLVTDDDMEFPETFLSESVRLVHLCSSSTVITGAVVEQGKVLAPKEPDFWGYRTLAIRTAADILAFSDPVTWFPVTVREKCRFDESVSYGSTEMDFAYQLVYHGFLITFVESLYAEHHGHISTATNNLMELELSRILYTLRRYSRWQKSVGKFYAFVVLEPFRLSLALLRRHGWSGIVIALKSYIVAMNKYMHEDRLMRA